MCRKFRLSVPVTSLLATIRVIVARHRLGDRACAANLTRCARKLHP